jgi:hypothetical protein
VLPRHRNEPVIERRSACQSAGLALVAVRLGVGDPNGLAGCVDDPVDGVDEEWQAASAVEAVAPASRPSARRRVTTRGSVIAQVSRVSVRSN